MFFSAVSIRVIPKRIKQNFTRKIRTILKTWSLSIPQTEPRNIPKWFPAEETWSKTEREFVKSLLIQ